MRALECVRVRVRQLGCVWVGVRAHASVLAGALALVAGRCVRQCERAIWSQSGQSGVSLVNLTAGGCVTPACPDPAFAPGR